MNRRMNVLWSFWACLTLVVALSSVIIRVSSNPTTTFAVEPLSSTGRAGGTFTVDIFVYDTDYMYAWQVYLTCDWDVLGVYSVAYAYFYDDYPEEAPEGSNRYTTIDPAYLMLSETMIGSHQGIDGVSGLLVSVTFLVKAEAATTLAIDNPTLTRYIKVFSPPSQEIITAFNKENSEFVAVWPEDINGDGMIDIFDISSIGIDYGRCTQQQKVPSTWSGAWTDPGYVVKSNDTYAYDAKKNDAEVYGGYGFVTTSWTSVIKVEVGVEAHEGSGSNDDLGVLVSNDGGSNYGAQHTVDTGTSDEFVWVDVTGDWSWTPDMLSDTYFRVKITYVQGGGSAEGIYVDWLPVRVTPEPQAYSPYTDLNGDGEVGITDLATVGRKFGTFYTD